MNNKLYNIVCDDWEVLYGTDGKIICQGHEIPWDEWFKAGQENPEAEILTIYLDGDMQEEYELWNFPDCFFDLPTAIQNSYE